MPHRPPFRVHFSSSVSRSALALILTASSIALTACGEAFGEKNGNGAGHPPAPVAVITVQEETLPITLEYAAQTLGSREVEVRARVPGILLKRNYAEGAKVKAGQSLFTIDPAPFEAAVARSEAEVAAAEARNSQAAREAARLTPLVQSKAISQKEFDDATSSRDIAAAELLGARARLREARLNLKWTRVESPLEGISSRALKSEGSLVSGPDVLLTTVTQTDPIQVIFGIPDNERLKLRLDADARRLTWPKDGRFKVALKLSDGSEYKYTGMTDFSDVRVSRDTGTSEARAELPNPDNLLQPGQFVRVELSGASRIGVFRVPQRAVQEGPQGKFVYVVSKENKAEVHPVEAGEWMGRDVVISKGLSSGDRVIVDGTIKLGPGAPVQINAPEANPAAPANGKQAGG